MERITSVFGLLVVLGLAWAVSENRRRMNWRFILSGLCGFANFGSVAVQIGGMGGLVPSRREVFARYSLWAMVGGVLTTLLSATIAGMFI